MSDVDEIDELRAKATSSVNCSGSTSEERWECLSTGDCLCIRIARAIRESDEAAGYITAKLEGVVNEKDRKG